MIDDQLELREKHFEMFEEFQNEIACGCHAQMTNAGTSGVYFSHDDYGCPQHCHHAGINLFAEWYCQCGASWKGRWDFDGIVLGAIQAAAYAQDGLVGAVYMLQEGTIQINVEGVEGVSLHILRNENGTVEVREYRAEPEPDVLVMYLSWDYVLGYVDGMAQDYGVTIYKGKTLCTKSLSQ